MVDEVAGDSVGPFTSCADCGVDIDTKFEVVICGECRAPGLCMGCADRCAEQDQDAFKESGGQGR